MELSMLPGYLLFGFLALMTIATSVAMVLALRPIFAVLFLVLNFMTVAILYILLGAPFIALAQITVYAGAIMVLFLFVVMMLGSDKLSFFEPLKGQRWLAGILAFLFLLLIGIFLVTQMGGQAAMVIPDSEFGSPHVVGDLLMEKYVLPIMIIGLIILSATIGAVVLTHKENHPKPVFGNKDSDQTKGEDK